MSWMIQNNNTFRNMKKTILWFQIQIWIVKKIFFSVLYIYCYITKSKTHLFTTLNIKTVISLSEIQQNFTIYYSSEYSFKTFKHLIFLILNIESVFFKFANSISLFWVLSDSEKQIIYSFFNSFETNCFFKENSQFQWWPAYTVLRPVRPRISMLVHWVSKLIRPENWSHLWNT